MHLRFRSMSTHEILLFSLHLFLAHFRLRFAVLCAGVVWHLATDEQKSGTSAKLSFEMHAIIRRRRRCTRCIPLHLGIVAVSTSAHDFEFSLGVAAAEMLKSNLPSTFPVEQSYPNPNARGRRQACINRHVFGLFPSLLSIQAGAMIRALKCLYQASLREGGPIMLLRGTIIQTACK